MEYPRFERGELTSYYPKIPKSERETIEKFLIYVSGSGGKRRVEESKRTLTHIRKVISKPLTAITLEDLRSYLALLNYSKHSNAYKNDLKATLKRFLRWYYKDWSARFENLEDIKLDLRMNEEKINSNTLIKKEEVEAIMKAETSFFWRSFFITLYESGLRPNELRNLGWEKVKLNIGDGLSEINVYATKTHRARSVYVKDATPYLTELKRRQGDKSPLVFPSPKTNKPLTRGGVSIWLNKISKKTIGRKAFPYLLRHSRATELYVNAGIPDKVAQKFMGHSQSMSQVYTHLSNKDVKEAVLKSVYQLEEITPEKKHELEKEIAEMREELKNFQDNVFAFLELNGYQRTGERRFQKVNRNDKYSAELNLDFSDGKQPNK